MMMVMITRSNDNINDYKCDDDENIKSDADEQKLYVCIYICMG